MPLTPEQIAAAGPWAVLVAVLIAIGVAGVGMIVRRIFVPGWIFDRSEDARKTTETTNVRNAESIEGLAESYKVMARSYDRIELRLEALERKWVKDE